MNITHIQSGVRKYQKKSLIRRLFQIAKTRKLACIGPSSYIDKQVKFDRFPRKISIGSNVVIKSGAHLCVTNPDSSISIGDWTTIGYHTYIFATAGISIGNNCLVAPFVYIVDANHGIKKATLIREQMMSASTIAIEDDVWIGTKAVILKGIRIGKGAVVSAGSIVKEDVPPYSIVSGNPAIVIGGRN